MTQYLLPGVPDKRRDEAQALLGFLVQVTGFLRLLLRFLCAQGWILHLAALHIYILATCCSRAFMCVLQVLDEEMAKLRDEKGADRFYGGHFEEARGLFARFSTSPELADFLTLGAYDYIVEPAPKQQRSRL